MVTSGRCKRSPIFRPSRDMLLSRSFCHLFHEPLLDPRPRRRHQPVDPLYHPLAIYPAPPCRICPTPMTLLRLLHPRLWPSSPGTVPLSSLPRPLSHSTCSHLPILPPYFHLSPSLSAMPVSSWTFHLLLPPVSLQTSPTAACPYKLLPPIVVFPLPVALATWIQLTPVPEDR